MRRWSPPLFVALLAAPAFAQKDPAAALGTMTAGDGLKVELFASEPMLFNPTSIDVDHKGRVWVAEAVNYRRKPPYNRPMLRKEGDRIVVLTDKDGDGKADDSTVFYQSEELYGPLSVLVIPSGKGQRVLVAQSPDILEFADADGDLKADGPPKKFLTGFGGFDHDHGVHGLHLGPDGKLYFTVGDSGVKDLQSSDGQGPKWTSNATDVQKGTVWRCELDGKKLELIAHNFRNNYEACVDSFGEIWLSDNDDDGNQQTRICHVYPGGNYGYGPRGPGQSHWHEEQPGIVHKTLRTGFGSPTGIQFYEGSLLPKVYHNTLMHCDAGPREVRAFTRKPKGAGYELDKANLLTSTDNWFRPSDVCTAPDGSVFVSDWYDPGVGGHGMGDHTRGRIYRLTPKDHKGYKVPEVKLDTAEGLCDALSSPNLSTSTLAFRTMHDLLEKNEKLVLEAISEPVKEVLFGGESSRPWLLGRCFWLKEHNLFSTYWMLEIPKPGHVFEANTCQRMRHRAMVNPAFKDLPKETDAYVSLLIEYGTPAIRREFAVSVRNADVEFVTKYFYPLAKLYDGKDIFYRAALNIACGSDPERRDKILADFEKHFPEWNDKVADLVWELRPKSMLPKMEKLLGDAKLTAAQKARIVDILATTDETGKTVLALLKGDAPAEVKAKAVENLTLFLPTRWNALTRGEELKATITDLLKGEATAPTGLRLVSAARYEPALDDVVKLAADAKLSADTRAQAVRTLGTLPSSKSVKALTDLIAARDRKAADPLAIAAVNALAGQITGRGDSGASKAALDALQALVLGKETDLQPAAVNALAGSRGGTQWLISIKERGGLPEALTGDVGRLLRNSPHQDLRNKALILFPPAGKLDPKKLPGVSVLATKKGNAEHGKAVLAKSLSGEAQCLKCHTVRGVGGSIGPDLSMIGKKGSKENLYDSLLTPSKAVADQYVSWRIDSDDGQSVTGLLVEETAAKITVRDANGKDYTFNTKDVRKQKDAKSIMPEDVIKAFSEDDLIDVVEYLMTLQTPSLTPDSWHLAGPFPAADDKALDAKLDPETKPFAEVTWKTIRGDAKGYFDLAAFHGKDAPNSVSYLHRVIESPTDQEVTVLLGTDDGCRLFVNGEKVFGHEHHLAATPAKDSVKVKLKKGANTVLLKINNGNNPHGFYFTIEGGTDLKLGK